MSESRRTITACLAGALFLASLGLGFGPARAEEEIIIGTGSEAGVYKILGEAICTVIEQSVPDSNCNAVKTRGSVANLKGLIKGKFDLGIVQSDVQYLAVKGTGPFAKVGPLKNLRSLFSAHPEALAILAGPETGIEGVPDLWGKRISVGKLLAGSNMTMKLLFDENQYPVAKSARFIETPAIEKPKALCRNEVDAVAFVAGHPNRLVSDMLIRCRGRLVPVEGSAIARMIEKAPFYVPAVIGKASYGRQRDDVPTVGVLATLVATDRLPPELGYAITRAVFENLAYIKSKDRSFRPMTAAGMATKGMTAPRHAGAHAYLKEAGRL